MSRALVMIMAGGTGGHIFPGLAVARALREQGYRIAWLGTKAGLEARLIPDAGIPLHTVAVRGLRGKSLVSLTSGLARLAWSIVQAIVILMRERPAVVIGMGGYVAAPGGLAAFLTRSPLFIHEQNAVAGSTNRFLRRFASRVFTAFDGAFVGSTEAEWIGNPVRSDIAAVGDQRNPYAPERALRVLVLGGSQGALAINRLLPDVLVEMDKKGTSAGLEVWHQVGKAHLDKVTQEYASRGFSETRVSAFIEDMAAAYAWADVVIARAGALTCSEVTAAACPAVLIPLPNAIDDHQRKNAAFLADVGAAIVLEQADTSASQLAELCIAFTQAPERLSNMMEAARSIAKLEATQRIVRACEEAIDDR